MFEQNKNIYLPMVFAALLFLLVFFDPSLYLSGKARNDLASMAGIIAGADIKKSNQTEQPPSLPAVLKKDIEPLNLSALAYLSAYADENNRAIIITEKNSNERTPIASITKLMTAIIAYENFDAGKEIAISKEIIESLGDDGSKRFLAGTKFKAKDLLRAMLIESNNDAAFAFASEMETGKFMKLMNDKAQEFGMINTFYANPAGLDPQISNEDMNYSTAESLLELAREIIKNYPETLSIMSLKEYDVYKSSGGLNHKAVNTNKLLKEGLSCGGKPLKIIGGKTGTTDYAKRNLFLITEAPNDIGYLINIILNTEDNFENMKSLIGWVCDSYEWR